MLEEAKKILLEKPEKAIIKANGEKAPWDIAWPDFQYYTPKNGLGFPCFGINYKFEPFFNFIWESLVVCKSKHFDEEVTKRYGLRCAIRSNVVFNPEFRKNKEELYRKRVEILKYDLLELTDLDVDISKQRLAAVDVKYLEMLMSYKLRICNRFDETYKVESLLENNSYKIVLNVPEKKLKTEDKEDVDE